MVAQEAWRFYENMMRGDDKGTKKLEGHMMSSLAQMPMTDAPRPVAKSGWTLDPWKPGQAGRLKNG